MFRFSKKDDALELDQDPILMSSLHHKQGYTVMEISTGIIAFLFLSSFCLGLFYLILG